MQSNPIGSLFLGISLLCFFALREVDGYVVVSQEASDVSTSDDVAYQCLFENLWTNESHPNDYPSDPQWSNTVLVSHSEQFKLFEAGSLASDGFGQFATTGNTSDLFRELLSNADTAVGATAEGDSFAVSDRPSVQVDNIRVDQYHRRLSTSTKMNGPDWFGGVDSFSLLTSGGFWLKNFTLEMYPYDAGRLSGETYSDPGPVTDPQDPVQQITVDNVPESSDVFMSPDGETVLPLARLSCSLVLDGLGPKPFPAANSPSDSSVATSAPNASSSLTPQVGSGEGPSTGASRGWSVAAELTTLFLALAAATFMFC